MKCLEMTLPMQNIYYLFVFYFILGMTFYKMFFFIIIVEMTFYKKVENMTLFKIYTVYFR